jgi:hypothetical protein
MSEPAEATLDLALFPDGRPPDGDPTGVALEQYRLILETTESLQARRQTLHTFFMSINSLFLAAIGLLAKESLDNSAVAMGVIVLGVAGGLLSESWRRQLLAYGNVSSSKWKVINEFEGALPSRPFCAEWKVLQEKPKYRSFTQNEGAVPVAFLLLYLISVIAGVLLVAGVG